MNPIELEPVKRLAKDIRAASATLSSDEARFLVDAYYTMQKNRIRSNNQIRALDESKEPHVVIDWLATQDTVLENQIKGALDVYSRSDAVGAWSRSIVGIGPVIAAGFLAHIDIEKAPTAGHVWNFAGLNPGTQWKKGQKRPWNADLKTLCWKLGESFVKTKAHEEGYYGSIYAQRKSIESERNDSGEFADQASAILEAKKIGKTTDAYAAYSTGKLPPAHIHARAKRYAVKLFLAHWHEVAFWDRFGSPPPEPYAIVHLGHAHRSTPPNWVAPGSPLKAVGP